MREYARISEFVKYSYLPDGDRAAHTSLEMAGNGAYYFNISLWDASKRVVSFNRFSGL
jgi:hypothetical protein